MTEEKLIQIEGSAPHTEFTANAVGRIDSSREIQFILVTRPNPDGKLAKAIEAVEEFISKKMEIKTFHELLQASPMDLAKVRSFAKDHGFELVKETGEVRGIKLKGAVQKIEHAFGITLNEYKIDDNTYFGHENPICLPESIAKIIEAVIGLDNFPTGNPPPNYMPYRIPDPIYSPTQIETLYNFPENKGEGVTLGIWALGGGYYQEDLEDYYRAVGFTDADMPDVESVGNNNPAPRSMVTECVQQLWGEGNLNAPYGATWTVEATQDVEVASVLAPRAKILVFFPETDGGSMTGLGLIESMFQILLESRQIDIISASWAYYESTVSKPFKRILDLYLTALTKLRGITFCFSSGDWGSQAKDKLEPSFPSTSPYVVSCGGTKLESNKEKTQITSETVWNITYKETFFSSTGGVSDFFEMPPWQKNAGVVEQCGSAGRGIPDVAANADFYTGMILIIGGVKVGSAGTSASAPLMAALFARIVSALGKSIGHVTPILYDSSVSVSFRAITETNNYPSAATLEKYVAQAGWNPCTGLGSPNGKKLLAALKTYYGQHPETEGSSLFGNIVAKIKSLF